MSGDKIMKNVPYLQASDLTDKGQITPEAMKQLGNKPVLVLVQANFCGYCTTVKPMFQQLANDVSDFACATIEFESDRGAKDKIEKAVSIQGFPTFVIFGKDGVAKGVHDKARTPEYLKASMK